MFNLFNPKKETTTPTYKHIIITVHGVLNGKHKHNWQDTLQDFTSKYPDVLVANFKYGKWLLFPYLSTLPKWLGGSFWLHKLFTNGLKRFVEKLIKDYPNAKLHLVSHSFGTWIAHEIVLNEKYPLGMVHLCAGVVSAHIQINELDRATKSGNVKRIYIHSSKEDEVCRLAPPPFGHIGYWGLLTHDSKDRIAPKFLPYDYLPIYNIVNNSEHSGKYYFSEDMMQFILNSILQYKTQ